MTVVIPLGKGSKHNNLELRYCLRSIEKHLKGCGDICIVGEFPTWLRDVIHIPFADGRRKQLNIRDKILAACDDDRVTDDFLFFNDDFFLLEDIQANEVKYCYCGNLAKNSEPAGRKLAGKLYERGFDNLNFDIHLPIVYNKDKFRHAVHAFDWETDLTIKSLYANYWKVTAEIYPDLKINTFMNYGMIKKAITGRFMFSVGDFGITPGMKHLWAELYPSKSKYES